MRRFSPGGTFSRLAAFGAPSSGQFPGRQCVCVQNSQAKCNSLTSLSTICYGNTTVHALLGRNPKNCPPSQWPHENARPGCQRVVGPKGNSVGFVTFLSLSVADVGRRFVLAGNRIPILSVAELLPACRSNGGGGISRTFR